MEIAVSTLCDVFRHVIDARPRADAFREKRNGRWVDISSATFAADVTAVGRGLIAQGLEPGDRVAILSENRYLWAVADAATITRGGVVVPIYATLPPRQIAEILADSQAKWVFVSTSEQLQKVFQVGDVLREIRAIIPFDPVAAESRAVVPLSELRGSPAMAPEAEVRAGAADLAISEFVACAADDLATIIYTSGTTSEPKGVMLTHGNLVSNAVANLDAFPITHEDIFLSFLPLSHVFERCVAYTMMLAGASIAYAESMESVADNAGEVRPTIMLGVPRFFEKFHDRVMAAIDEAPAARRGLFHWAATTGLRVLDRTLEDRPVPASDRLQHRLASGLVFRKLRRRVGGRLRFFVSGSAPLRGDIIRFFHAVGIPIYEGYGLTETSPVVAANTPDAMKIGSVGRPYVSVGVRVADDGEIQVRGPGVTRGYFRKADETRAQFTDDGWLRTGDVGRIDEDGYLFITDRKKDLIITSGGKNVAPQPIEAILKRSELIADVMLLGDRRRFISALIVPEFAILEASARAQGIEAVDRAALVRDERVRALFEREVERANAELARHETIKKFFLVPDELTVENGALTPTMKLKRRVVENRFKEEIDRLYA